ncbi:MAG: carboxypeptidase regulatory-like domain-containing protein [Gemmatimonadota bacterium]
MSRWSMVRPLRVAVLCSALAALASPIHAQEPPVLRGQVVDSITGAPLAGTLVRISALNRYTVTNDGGWFVFPGLEERLYLLNVGQLGYADAIAATTVPQGSPLRIRLVPKPVELEAVRAYNNRLNSEAKARAHPYILIGSGFFQVFDRDKILETGAVHCLEFLALGPHMPVVRCDLNDPTESMCTRMPLMHRLDLGRMGTISNRTWVDRQRSRERRGISGIKWVAQPPVFLDDEYMPGGIAGLADVPMGDIHRVETFGIRGEISIRFYTAGYLQLLATGVRRPVFHLAETERYSPPWIVVQPDTVGGWR